MFSLSPSGRPAGAAQVNEARRRSDRRESTNRFHTVVHFLLQTSKSFISLPFLYHIWCLYAGTSAHFELYLL